MLSIFFFQFELCVWFFQVFFLLFFVYLSEVKSYNPAEDATFSTPGKPKKRKRDDDDDEEEAAVVEECESQAEEMETDWPGRPCMRLSWMCMDCIRELR